MRDEIPPGFEEYRADPLPNGETEKEKEKGRSNQIEQIVAALLDAGVRFWRNEDGAAFATVRRGGTLQRFPVRSQGFCALARAIYGEKNTRSIEGRVVPRAIANSVWSETLPNLEALAAAGPIATPRVRTAQMNDALVIDLGDPSWRAIEVTAEEWRIVEETEAPLIRPAGLRALPLPERDPDALERFRRLVNVSDETALMLICGWMVAAFWPTGPYPILALNGESESGKTSACRLIRSLVDPNVADLRPAPRTADDLLVAAGNGRVVGFENLSSVSAELADDLCRLATGAGFGKRRLYTDADEHLAFLCAPVLLNGIPHLTARGDLASRTFSVTCPPIPADARMTEDEFTEELEKVRPGMFALLLDALVLAWGAVPTMKLKNPPRLGLAAKIAIAAAPAFGWTGEEMRGAIENARSAAAEQSIDSDPIGRAIRDQIMASAIEWRGTASALLATLNGKVPEAERGGRSWPVDATRLSNRLNRLAPSLRLMGIEIDEERRKDARLIAITKNVRGTASSASSASPQRNNNGKSSAYDEAEGDADENPSVTPASPSVTEPPSSVTQRHPSVTNNTLKNKGNDADDARDAIFPTFSEGDEGWTWA